MPGPNDPLPCGFGRLNPGNIAVSGRAVAEFVRTLSDLARRPVVDKTGLTGTYDFALKYAPESAGAVNPFARLGGAPPPPDNPDLPSFFTAVQEQLGLRLDSARGPVEVVVVEKLEKPTLD
jgi:uncharacterized protein (TIGR03435 family)